MIDGMLVMGGWGPQGENTYGTPPNAKITNSL
jgi:hypothetical protein